MDTLRRGAPSDVRDVAQWLSRGDLCQKRALVGFDGYVDTIYRVVRTRSEAGCPQYYQTIADYGQRILNAAGKSADMDIRLQRRQMGGNAPLMADGMAALGDSAALVGALGYPQMHPCFDALRAGVDAFSFAEPCQTIGFEFDDGKIMMGDLGDGDAAWARMADALGQDEIRRQAERADLIAILNWSAHPGVGEIARRVCEFACSLPAQGGVAKRLFFDLSDPVSLPKERLSACLDTLAALAGSMPAVLGMNENEAGIVLKCLFPQADCAADALTLARAYGDMAVRRLHLHALTIHTADRAVCVSADGYQQANGFYVKKPRFLTGGGDHYNAGFCHGLAHGLPLAQCLTLGSAAAAYYVQNGRSAARGDLLEIITNGEACGQ